MAFPTSSAQQETNRKILEDIQQKKQLLQKSVAGVPLAGGIIGLGNTAILNNVSLNQMPAPQLLGQPTADFQQQAPNAGSTITAAPRSAFNPTSSTTLGFFIPQDSYFGNSFIPVLPRLEPLPTTASSNHNAAK